MGDQELLKEKVTTLVNYHNKILQNLYEADTFNVDDILAELNSYKYLYDNYSSDVQETVYQWKQQDKSILFEGAQGSLLDIDHGTYPYVTSVSYTHLTLPTKA